MNVVIYGIDESDFRCGGCIFAKKVFDHLNINYTFKKVLTNVDGFPTYDKVVYAEMIKKGKFATKVMNYPIIFINDDVVRVKNLVTHLYELGYEVEINDL